MLILRIELETILLLAIVKVLIAEMRARFLAECAMHLKVLVGVLDVGLLVMSHRLVNAQCRLNEWIGLVLINRLGRVLNLQRGFLGVVIPGLEGVDYLTVIFLKLPIDLLSLLETHAISHIWWISSLCEVWIDILEGDLLLLAVCRGISLLLLDVSVIVAVDPRLHLVVLPHLRGLGGRVGGHLPLNRPRLRSLL